MRIFFAQVMREAIETMNFAGEIRLLDAGCGSGAWLNDASELLARRELKHQLFGFDLTEEMVNIAREKLAVTSASSIHIKVGDILSESSYRFDEDRNDYDLVITYDVVQQLPPRQQYSALERMWSHVAPGGAMIIFDHDKDTAYGRAMGRKKFLTQYLRLPLVPRYYCNAKYPPLKKFAEKFSADFALQYKLIAGPDDKKFGLILFKSR
ncbi:MAG: hypothetical protein Tsb0016_26710 [Sphingomonadales bacterium]